jgi:hypothetical protein
MEKGSWCGVLLWFSRTGYQRAGVRSKSVPIDRIFSLHSGRVVWSSGYRFFFLFPFNFLFLFVSLCCLLFLFFSFLLFPLLFSLPSGPEELFLDTHVSVRAAPGWDNTVHVVGLTRKSRQRER